METKDQPTEDQPADGVRKPDQAAAEPQQQKPDKARRRLWLLLLLLLVVLLAGGGGYYYWSSHRPAKQPATSVTINKTSSTAQSQAAAHTCAAGLTSYEATSLGFGFCYPAAWGAPTPADAKLAATDTGSRWIISFAAKPAVHIGVASRDWTTQVGRDGTCPDPTNVAPDTTTWSTAWQTQNDGTDVLYAGRDVEKDGSYVIREYADSVLTSGVCITGVTTIDTPVYLQTSASYYMTFAGSVSTPAAHMANDTGLISAAERQAFYDFVKSVYKL